jgi:hypothetical protein
LVRLLLLLLMGLLLRLVHLLLMGLRRLHMLLGRLVLLGLTLLWLGLARSRSRNWLRKGTLDRRHVVSTSPGDLCWVLRGSRRRLPWLHIGMRWLPSLPLTLNMRGACRILSRREACCTRSWRGLTVLSDRIDILPRVRCVLRVAWS